MIKHTFKIGNRLGLHARPAARLVRITGKFKSRVKINKDGMIADGKSIMGLMSLAAEVGSHLEFEIDGEDEQVAFEAIRELFENNFYEE